MSTPSEFARQIVERYSDDACTSLIDQVDQALAPVRECLEGLRDVSGCWCVERGTWVENYSRMVARADDDHDDSCLAAQQLYERLKVK